MDNSMTFKQTAFIKRLVAEGRDIRAIADGRIAERANDALEDVKFVGRRDAADVITALLKMPAATTSTEPPAEPGMYKDPAGEAIYKVQRAQESGNLYAKRLQAIGGQRLTEADERVHFEFVYEPGLIRRVAKSWRMTLDQAKSFGIKYGVCCVCGAFLKDASSVENGIGPVCAKRI